MVFRQLGVSVVEISEVECMLVHLQIQTMKECHSRLRKRIWHLFFQFFLEVTVNTVCKLINLVKHKNRLHPISALFYFKANLQAFEVWQTQVRKHAKCRTLIDKSISFPIYLQSHKLLKNERTSDKLFIINLKLLNMLVAFQTLAK